MKEKDLCKELVVICIDAVGGSSLDNFVNLTIDLHLGKPERFDAMMKGSTNHFGLDEGISFRAMVDHGIDPLVAGSLMIGVTGTLVLDLGYRSSRLVRSFLSPRKDV